MDREHSSNTIVLSGQPSVTSSVDSGLVKTSDEEEEEYFVVRAVDKDESIAWLQERIDSMNQTLEAYEHSGRCSFKQPLPSKNPPSTNNPQTTLSKKTPKQ